MTEGRFPVRRPRRRGQQRGFTLIEILIAFAILAVALAALFQAFSGGLRATTATERRNAAVMLARSLLERVGADIPLAPGELAGVSEDGQRWRIAIAPSPLIVPEQRANSPIIPFDVAVSVVPDGGRAIVLTSLRLAPVAAANDGDVQ